MSMDINRGETERERQYESKRTASMALAGFRCSLAMAKFSVALTLPQRDRAAVELLPSGRLCFNVYLLAAKNQAQLCDGLLPNTITNTPNAPRFATGWNYQWSAGAWRDDIRHRFEETFFG